MKCIVHIARLLHKFSKTLLGTALYLHKIFHGRLFTLNLVLLLQSLALHARYVFCISS